MMKLEDKKLVLILTKDLGDTVLASPAIREIISYAQEHQYQVATIGSGMSQKAAALFADTALPAAFDPQTEKTDLAINLNFHDPDDRSSLHPDTPLYSLDDIRFIEADQPAYYKGAVVADRHMLYKFEEMLTKSGLVGGHRRLSAPTAPARVTNPQAQQAAMEKFNLPDKYMLMMPGCAPTRPYKRWSPDAFAELADKMSADGITPVLIGGPVQDELDICADIRTKAQSQVVDLCGKTSLEEICSLSAGADCVVANDTGPAHMAAASGAQTYGLFSRHTDYQSWGLVSSGAGDNAHTIVSDEYMSDLSAQDVYDTIQQVKHVQHAQAAPVPNSPGR